tara:strand:- start:135 stop:536 length:402 start_codon:yes stop_codon:yes gene_type:complete
MSFYKYILRNEKTAKYNDVIQQRIWDLKIAYCNERNDIYEDWADPSMTYEEQKFKPEEEDDYPYTENGIFIYKVVEYVKEGIGKTPTGRYWHTIVMGYDLPESVLIYQDESYLEPHSKQEFLSSKFYGDEIDY